MRWLAAVAVAFVGLALLGTDLRPFVDTAGTLRMAWSFLGRDLAFAPALPATSFAERLAALLPGLALASLAVSAVLGIWTADRIAARLAVRAGTGAKVLCTLAWAIALDPFVAYYVSTRSLMNAERYLDVGDAFRSLGLGCLAIAATLLLSRGSGEALPVEGEAASNSRRFSRFSLAAAMAVAFLLPEAISWFVLRHRPLVNDEFAYLFHAQLFSGGRIARDMGPLADFFPSMQTQIASGRVFPVVFPGHSAVLALGGLIGMPALVPRLLASTAVLLTFDLGRRLGVARPLWGAWLLAISPAFLGVETLLLAHGTALPCLLFFVWSTLLALDPARSGNRSGIAIAMASGAGFSVAFAARPVTAIAVGAAVLVLHLRERPHGTARLIAAALVGALPAAVGFLAIDGTLAGGWFRTVYGTYNLADNAVFGRTDLATAGSITLFNLSRMSTWLSGVGPGWLLPAIAVSFAPLRERGWFLLAVPASLFALYGLHPFHGIPWVGPVYQSEALPYLALLSAQGLAAVQSAFGSATRRILMTLCVAGSALLLFVHFSIARDEVELRDRPYAAARRAGILEGVVFLPLEDLRSWRLHPLAPPPTGTRLVFARDLGPRNADLLQALGDPPAWTWDSLSGELQPR